MRNRMNVIIPFQMKAAIQLEKISVYLKNHFLHQRKKILKLGKIIPIC